MLCVRLDVKAAGGILTAKQAPHRPGTAPALGLRAGSAALILPQADLERENRMMKFTNWLRGQRPVLASAAVAPNRSRKPRLAVAPRFRPQLEALEDRNLLSTLTVLNNGDSGPGSLRAAIAGAQSGDTIVFDPRLDGQTIALTSGELAITQSLRIIGPGVDRLTVSGNNAGRIFDLTGSGLTVKIASLTISDGLAAQGGGIENLASNLTLSAVNLSNDQAIGAAGGDAQGGGVFNGGAASLRVVDSVFTNDLARGGDGLGGSGAAGYAYGGALYNLGVASLSGTTLTGNHAIGGASSGFGGSGFGGAITNDVTEEFRGTLTISDGHFLDNHAIGGVHGLVLPPGNPFSVGDGGAIDNDAALVVRDSTFTDNQALGGAGLSGAAGGNGGVGAIKSGSEDDDPPASATVRDSTFIDNRATGGAGGDHATGGQGACGAFLADHGANVLSDCTFLGNEAIGGAGGIGANGGPGRGGALRLGPRDGSVSVLATDCYFAGNEAIGGAAGLGGVGGLGEGGAIANVQISANNYTSTLTLRDCVVTGNNMAVGGAGAVGGVGRGGGISNAGGPTLTSGGISTTVIDCLISDNKAVGGDGSAGNGGNGLGGGVFTDKTAVLTVKGSTIIGNDADGGTGAPGFSNGKGQGGGVFIAAGGDACIDLVTIITGNHASTSDDDVFGVFTIC
jgi:hypothetical protein